MPPPSTPLPPDALVRWEIRLRPPILPPGLVAALSVDPIRDGRLSRDLARERARGFRLRQLISEFSSLAVALLFIGLAATTVPFAMVWGLTGIGGHNLQDATVATSLASFGLIVAVYMLAMSSIATTPRDQLTTIGGAELFCFLALPLLMYAVASPATSQFVVAGSARPPTLFEWSAYFAYMFLDTVTLGILQGALGDHPQLTSPLPLSGLALALLRAVMAAGAIALIYRIGSNLLKGTEEHVCTLGELRGLLARDPRKYSAAIISAHPLVEGGYRDVRVQDFLRAPSWQIFANGDMTPRAAAAAADELTSPFAPAERRKRSLRDFWTTLRKGFSVPASIGSWVTVWAIIYPLTHYVFGIPSPAARESAMQFGFVFALIVTVVRGERTRREASESR